MKLNNENKLHGDFIVGEFEDRYINLPLKTFSGYSYLDSFCSETYLGWQKIFQNITKNI